MRASTLLLPSRLLLLPVLLLITERRTAEAALACLTTDYCEATLRPGSKCVNGFCDNPYQYGCLQSRNSEFRLRVCHSEDAPDAAERGLCRDPTSSDGGAVMNYPEIRILSQNWESPFFEAWILQIILSEMLDVPVTLETGVEGLNVNFYDPAGRFDYGIGYDMNALEVASDVHDCRTIEQGEGEEYKSCAHAILEIWAGQDDVIIDLVEREKAEPKSFIGLVGEEGWKIPKYTAEKDASLLSYFGLTGPVNRRKLAERFLRPTTWRDYCEDVSVTNCQNDTAAVRPPESQDEAERFFVDGMYTGYFRRTEDNDCDRWPTNCTGHFLDYPCGWTSLFVQQAHHLDIGLKSNGKQPGANGYSYTELVEIWYAANWTKSDVIGWWWRPEALYQHFQGTDFELQDIVFPPHNHRCNDNRAGINDRCSDDEAVRVGDPAGVCAIPPIPNYKVLSTGLYKLTYDPEIPEGRRSPAYDVVKEFTIDGFQLGQLFEYWLSADVDRYGFDPRDAVCRWVNENFEDLQRFIPRTYPRSLEEEGDYVLAKVAAGFGGLALALTLVCIGVTYKQRKKRVFQYAQVEFVFFMLFGLLLVSLAAVITPMAPTDARCVATIWLLNIGYTFELVPLVVKIAAINRLLQAAKRMKRIKLDRRLLFGAVAVLSAVVVLYQTLWTILDPPVKEGFFTLTDQLAKDGSTNVLLVYYCESSSPVWMFLSVGTQALLLLCASLLAFLTRKMRKDLNEANTIAFLIYWNFLCVLLRLILLLLGDSIDVSKLNRSLSMILSADTFATIVIYFVPKFRQEEGSTTNASGSSLAGSAGTPPSWRIGANDEENESSRRQAFGVDSPPPAVIMPKSTSQISSVSRDNICSEQEKSLTMQASERVLGSSNNETENTDTAHEDTAQSALP